MTLSINNGDDNECICSGYIYKAPALQLFGLNWQRKWVELLDSKVSSVCYLKLILKLQFSLFYLVLLFIPPITERITKGKQKPFLITQQIYL